MRQLSGLDALFLQLETPEMPMHVGALHLLELPSGYRGSFVRDLRRHLAARLPLAPALRRRVWRMPLGLANPAWVDAEPDLERHVVEVRLPASARRGSGMPEIEAAVARLHPQRLPRDRPLWKFHVLTGLAPSAAGGRRVALYSQLHHAAVDGQAAVALAAAILDTTPVPRTVEPRAALRPRRYSLSVGEMLRGALAAEAAQLVGIARQLPGALATLGGAASQLLSQVAGPPGAGGARNLTLAPRTALNASVGRRRAFAAVSLPLRELKALGKAHGATLNDVVLFLCSTALRSHLAVHRALPRKSLVAAVPVSLRGAGDASPDNQASMSLVSLGTHLADPALRLAHIRASSASMKALLGKVRGVLPTDYPSIGVPWLVESLAALYGRARVAERIPSVANLVISNVPGSPVPLYLAGARMLTNWPTSIVVHGLALNITVQSYHRSMEFGLMADARALPDVRRLADALVSALGELRALPVDRPARAKRRSTAAR